MRSRGVEPPRPLGAQASETCVSANSTTTAYWKFLRNRDRNSQVSFLVLSCGAGAYGFDQGAASVSVAMIRRARQIESRTAWTLSGSENGLMMYDFKATIGSP